MERAALPEFPIPDFQFFILKIRTDVGEVLREFP